MSSRRRVLSTVVLALVALNLAAGLLASVLTLRHSADHERLAVIALARIDVATARYTAQRQDGAPAGELDGAVRHLMALLDDGDLTGLKAALAARPADPAALPAWMDRVSGATAPLADAQAAAASRDSRTADVETGLLMVTGLAVAVTLFRGVDAARRRGRDRATAARAEAQARSEARFRALVTHASDVLLVLDAAGTVTYRGPSADRLLDVPDGPFPVTAALQPDQRQNFLAALRTLAEGERGELRSTTAWRGSSGGTVWLACSLTDLRDDPDVGGVVLNGHDVTSARELEEQLRARAFTDDLTGLANRALFTDRLEQLLAADRPLALVYADLDAFKEVNDGRGHLAGDDLLQRVAEALRGCARLGDTVARLGGDEFAVLLPGAGVPEARRVAERLLVAVRDVPARASVGITATDELASGPDDLVRRADLAMYTAKHRGGDAVVVFEPGLHSAALERAQLRGDLARAVHNDELRLLYQPVVDLDDGRILGTEALLRWEHPERGTVSPVVFVPAAEETQDIVAFGRWVLRRACRQASEWQRHHGAGEESVRMAVNVSVTQLRDPDLVDDVRAALEDSGWPAEHLTLEVTESQVMPEADQVLDVLHRLRALGCRIAVDDFGTGYSSLAYLERLPVDVLKIDRSFVERVVESRETRVVVESMVTMADRLGLDVVAEGVEQEEQARVLREVGVHRAQGFLWARPLTPEALGTRLAAGEHRRNRQQALPLV